MGETSVDFPLKHTYGDKPAKRYITQQEFRHMSAGRSNQPWNNSTINLYSDVKKSYQTNVYKFRDMSDAKHLITSCGEYQAIH